MRFPLEEEEDVLGGNEKISVGHSAFERNHQMQIFVGTVDVRPPSTSYGVGRGSS